MVIETAGVSDWPFSKDGSAVYMPTIDCPFQTAKREVVEVETGNLSHHRRHPYGKRRHEKMAMGIFRWEVTAVVGPYPCKRPMSRSFRKAPPISRDIGMTGPLHSVIGSLSHREVLDRHAEAV